MTDFYRQTETPLDKAVDRAIAEANADYLASDEGRAFIEQHRANVERWTAEAAARGEQWAIRATEGGQG